MAYRRDGEVEACIRERRGIAAEENIRADSRISEPNDISIPGAVHGDLPGVARDRRRIVQCELLERSTIGRARQNDVISIIRICCASLLPDDVDRAAWLRCNLRKARHLCA